MFLATTPPVAFNIWITLSAAEKAIARKAFDAALQRELDAVIREAKERAACIALPADLWELERWLTQCREDIIPLPVPKAPL